MSYYVCNNGRKYDELPDRIPVREVGWLGANRFYGEPIIDYWYVPEEQITALKELIVEMYIALEWELPESELVKFEQKMKELGVWKMITISS